MNLRKITTAIKSNDLEFWQTINSNDIDDMRQQAASSFLLKHQKKLIIVLGFLVMCLAGYGVNEILSIKDEWSSMMSSSQAAALFKSFIFMVGVATVATFLWTIGAIFFFGLREVIYFWGGNSSLVTEKLQPLSKRESVCSAAMKMNFMEMEECRRYRDNVIASGRELLVVDYDNMVFIKLKTISQHNAQKVGAQHKENCQKLHGIG